MIQAFNMLKAHAGNGRETKVAGIMNTLKLIALLGKGSKDGAESKGRTKALAEWLQRAMSATESTLKLDNNASGLTIVAASGARKRQVADDAARLFMREQHFM